MADVTLAANEKVAYTTNPVPADAVLGALTAASSDETVCTADAALVLGVAAGTATVTVTSTADDGTIVSGSFDVEVTEVVVNPSPAPPVLTGLTFTFGTPEPQ